MLLALLLLLLLSDVCDRRLIEADRLLVAGEPRTAQRVLLLPVRYRALAKRWTLARVERIDDVTDRSA
uniref:Putative secreted protein n=1 Tax=Anopheles triannulatus TaxID=58253 RepID=A0A2M4B618_9DIPT